MTKFLIKASYSPEGVKGLLRTGGTSRKQAIEKMIGDVGGKMESFNFAFGDHDVYVIAEMPDTITVAAMAMTINSSSLASITTTILLSPEDVDKAARLTVNYRTPGT